MCLAAFYSIYLSYYIIITSFVQSKDENKLKAVQELSDSFDVIYGTAREPGKTKPEIGAADGTLPEVRAHAVGARVVQVERENQCEKRQKVCHRRGG